MRTLLALAAAALVSATIAGCFSEHVAPQPVRRDVATICASPDTPPPGVVVIRALAFRPASIAVSAGDTVTWVNCETNGLSHTSTSDSGVWGSSLIAPGTTFERVFAAAGSFPFHCEPHPFMTGTVVVQ